MAKQTTYPARLICHNVGQGLEFEIQIPGGQTLCIPIFGEAHRLLSQGYTLEPDGKGETFEYLKIVPAGTAEKEEQPNANT